MRVLVTRSPSDAAPLVADLRARGHESLVEPLFAVAVLPHPPAALSLALPLQGRALDSPWDMITGATLPTQLILLVCSVLKQTNSS